MSYHICQSEAGLAQLRQLLRSISVAPCKTGEIDSIYRCIRCYVSRREYSRLIAEKFWGKKSLCFLTSGNCRDFAEMAERGNCREMLNYRTRGRQNSCMLGRTRVL